MPQTPFEALVAGLDGEWVGCVCRTAAEDAVATDKP
jgi:hypothetical protein